MTPLRTRMIRELELQRKAPGTVSCYVKSVEELAHYFGRSPDKISREEVRSYLHYLITERKLSYCAGLRVGELVQLKTHHIQSDRLLIRGGI